MSEGPGSRHTPLESELSRKSLEEALRDQGRLRRHSDLESPACNSELNFVPELVANPSND